MVDMKTDMALDVMMDIIPDVAAIMNDTEAEEIIAKVKARDKDLETGDAMQVLIPLFARKYKPELYRIVAAFQGITAEEVGKQNIADTVMYLASGLRLYFGFFGCCLHMVRSM